MSAIKLQNGKVVLKDGKVSCECCAPACSGLSDTATSAVLLSLQDYSAIFAGGSFSATLGHTIDVSTPTVSGASVRMTGSIAFDIAATTAFNQCTKENLIPTVSPLSTNTISCAVTPPSGPYTLTTSECSTVSPSVASISARLNNSSGSYILNLRFGLTLAHIINYAWTSSDPANFPNVAIEQTLTNQLLTGVALGGSGSSISLVINGTAYSVAVQTSVFLGSGSPTSTTAVFAPIVLNYVSAAP